MAKHQDALLSFDVPRDWEDHTVVAYISPSRGDDSARASVVVSREHVPDGQSLQQLADRRLASLSARLDGFLLREQTTIEIDGSEAVDVRFGSLSDGGALDQRMVLVRVGERVAVITCTSPRDDIDQLAPLFDRILSSVRL